MTDKRHQDDPAEADDQAQSDSGEPSPTPPDGTEQKDAGGMVRKGGIGVALVILVSLVAYLLADRYTPYTSQARIDGYVVGVAPQVAGIVTQVWVRNNQAVEKGEKLFEIDPSQYRIALNKALSDIDNTRRQVGAGGAAVEAARANLVAAQANALKAQQDATRLQRLYAEDAGTISVRRLEIARASHQQAEAQVAAAKANIQQAIEQMGGDDSENNTLLNSALVAVEKAELDLSNTVVRASSRGVITDLRADVGQFAGTGSPVLTLVAINDVWVNAEFTENNLGHVAPGTPVDLLFDALPGQVFHGEVRSIGLGVSDGRSQPAGTLPTLQNDRDWLRQAQRFPVIVSFDSAQDPALQAQLRIGGQVSVIAYGEGAGPLSWLGKLYIRIASWLTYVY
ncbi:HlyD family secretion protein [Halomonas binhaiensis]|uniref:HlyD family secretion protein n=1 Tax=Halomonas binhaiensis TaxID=2562282 RepID=A0A856QW59_9GAMM|nr:HlyD family secretion protein [Halomonas binhaiensis]QEM84125.2 HlyD family secretion protein [Halomonas binhaiensis]